VYASKREVEHIRHVDALDRLERKEYTIMVPLANPASVPSLMHIAIAIAKQHNANVLLVHVVEVDERTPLIAGLEGGTGDVRVFDIARGMLDEAAVPNRSLVKVSHRISDGIIETAEAEQANFILLGRQKNPTFFERVYSSVLDSVLHNAPCEVAVLHGNVDPAQVRRLLIPYGENIHTQLAIEIAPALVRHFESAARVAVVFEPGDTGAAKEAQKNAIAERIGEVGLDARIVTLSEDDVLEGLVRESRYADLLVMGGRSGDFISLILGQSLTQEITENAHCPVLWIKEYEEAPSFWKALFTSPVKEPINAHE
jgi:nucleotide-binding universal stress UspA family protein